MLARYDGKPVRVTTEDGRVFSGEAETFSAGYGLHELGLEEESLAFDGEHVFLSEIARIELLPSCPAQTESGGFLPQIEALFLAPCRIADILPERVPRDAPGQAFAVYRYYQQPERLSRLYRRFAEILLRLNCYEEMAASFDNCETWERDPEPEGFADRLAGMDRGFMRAIFPARRTMIEIDAGETRMTVNSLDAEWLDRVGALCSAEGLFFREAADEL